MIAYKRPAPFRGPIPLGGDFVRPRVDHYFGNVVLFIPPYFVYFRGLIERDAMGDDVTRIDLPLLDSLQQRFHIVVHVRLTHLHGDTLAKCSAKRNFVQQSPVYARNGQSSAFPDGAQKAMGECVYRLSRQRQIKPLYSPPQNIFR